MTHGILPRTGILILLPILAPLLAGCNTSLQRESYPDYLKYPAREDVIVKSPSQKEDVKKLPPPSDLEQFNKTIEQDNNPDSKAVTFSPSKLDKGDRDKIKETLGQLFGTPAVPKVALAETPEKGTAAEYWRRTWASSRDMTGEREAIDDLLLDDQRLQRGSKLYRRHCLHCHGVAGDGRGPTGPWVHPHPRDYRSGQFKFISTAVTGGSRKPRRDDLLRILRNGIDSTSMPAFGLLPEDELEYLVSYVIHLSIRGQAEYGAMLALLSGATDLDDLIKKAPSKVGDNDLGKVEQLVYANASVALVDWALSNQREPLPVAPPGSEDAQLSIQRGYKLFIDPTQGGCLKCHVDFGRQSDYRFDVWGTNVRPANLTTGTYRGGRRPIDIMNRLKGGIDPSGMPVSAVKVYKADGKTVDQDATDKANWDLVNFVRALPYPGMLPKDVRIKVYGASEK